MAKEEIAARVNEIYGKLFGDLPSLFAEGLMTENFVLDNFLPTDFPFGGTYAGLAGLQSYLGEIGSSIQIKNFQITDVLVDGNTAMIIGSEHSEVLATGKTYQMDWVHQLRFNDNGALEYMKEYNDTARMAVAFAA